METINNVAAAAAKAVWGNGETNQEPISGAQGNVSKGEPYDAGNLDSAEQNKEIDATTNPSKTTTNDTTNATKDSAASAKPAPADTTAGQNDTREPEDAKAQDEAVEAKGPGPKPVEVVAKEHGGDAGNVASASSENVDGPDSTSSSEGSDLKTNGKDATENQDKPHEATEGEIVHASGLAADGGDFDATKPGAGQEAERLMEQKGMRKTGSGENQDADTASSPDGKKDKPSLGERIKAKLHKH